MVISPQKFISLGETSDKMMFCQIKIGNSAYNTKICEGKSKPSWDENIEIRKNLEENVIIAQVWNFSKDSKEELVGESNIDLNSKEIDIYKKLTIKNEFPIQKNGDKKGNLLMEISWVSDEKIDF